ncbi:uncharacterized protein LOC109811316 isoform X2 [Cajanus cajan]|nr:uncharacterized protein LOC109811316 isoform X2 [Cajanus cajan]XP_029129784.1 uncharacterized protein LOC109811316 isoform X2 [Cajanus cajan]
MDSIGQKKYTNIPTKVHEVKLRINHAGMFVSHPCLMYVKGKVNEMEWGWDVDEMSYIDLTKLVETLGYKDFKCMWYSHPKFSLAHGLNPLNSDVDVLKFVNDVKGYEVVDVYVEHLTNTPIEVEIVDLDNVEGNSISEDKGDEESQDRGLFEVRVEEEDDYKIGEDMLYATNDEEEVESEDISVDDSDHDEKWEWTRVFPLNIINSIGCKKTISSSTEGGDVDHIGIDHNIEEGGNGVRAATLSRNLEPITNVDFEIEDEDSDFLQTPSGSDDDKEERPKFPKFKMPIDNSNVRFEVGLIFNTKKVVKEAIKEYAMVQKRNLHFNKNDKSRMVIRCVKDCPFNIRVSKSEHHEYWQVVSLYENHTCHRTAKNRQAKTEWLARKFTLIEGVKFYITNRIVSQRGLMLRYQGKICPIIQQLLEKNKQDSNGWSPNWCGDERFSLFEVSRDTKRYVVNICEHSCSCRRWELTGIPCCHVIACMWHNNYVAEDYVCIHYRKTTFLATYSHISMPSNGPNLWPIVHCEPIKPPLMRRAPGRPKKQRKRSIDEPQNPHKLPRQHTTIKCKKCENFGHNKRTCKGKTVADREIPKGENKVQASNTHTGVQASNTLA